MEPNASCGKPDALFRTMRQLKGLMLWTSRDKTFSKFNGHAAAWFHQKQQRLSPLLPYRARLSVD
jgi:hypothetical protein